MVVDLELTTERAMEDIGEIIPIQTINKHGEPIKYGPDEDPFDPSEQMCVFSWEDGYYDFTWTFDKESKLIKTIEEVNQIQKEHNNALPPPQLSAYHRFLGAKDKYVALHPQ